MSDKKLPPTTSYEYALAVVRQATDRAVERKKNGNGAKADDAIRNAMRFTANAANECRRDIERLERDGKSTAARKAYLRKIDRLRRWVNVLAECTNKAS